MHPQLWLLIGMHVAQVSQLADATGSENRDGMQGVRQMLEKNEGLFCMNTMAKRVNIAAPSAISTDKYIDPHFDF
jgi:DNA-directed RNA polymerase beta' subunit